MVDNRLLHQKVFGDEASKIGITARDKSVVKGWIGKLNVKSDLDTEIRGYGIFQEEILRKLLGYDVTNNIKTNYPIGTGAVEFALRNKNSAEMAAIIEIKGKGADLNKAQTGAYGGRTPIQQAADYAGEDAIKYYIVTNYSDFYLFVHAQPRRKFVHFKFEDLVDESELKKFKLIFSKEHFLDTDVNNETTVERLLNKTVQREQEFSTEFYKLYHSTKQMTIKEMEENNPKLPTEDIRGVAQIILNRCMFIMFAEDETKQLLPRQTMYQTLSDPIKRDVLNNNHNELWSNSNKLFLDINIGNPKKNIQKYNGGLFRKKFDDYTIRDNVASDFYQGCEVKTKLKLPDNIKGDIKGKNVNPIFRNLMHMSSFDFEKDVGVEMLGNIFEQSIQQEAEAAKKGRRTNIQKMEAIYYTPEYITEFICRNTIIPFLSKSGTSDLPKLIDEYSGDIEQLEKKLQDIKILDPACGSGAFIVKAADTLLEIWDAIFSFKESIGKYQTTAVKKRKKITGLSKITRFTDPEKMKRVILDNIYGVDINIESVEITKLSFFLKVAPTKAVLPILGDNIKNGNSLIDNESFPKGFDWKTKFQKIIQNGGFDVIIGNPPYIKEYTNKPVFEDVKNSKSSVSEYYEGKMDYWYMFTCISLDLLKEGGYHSFIATNNWNTASGATILRNKIIAETKILRYIDFVDFKVFNNADQQTMIFILRKDSSDNSFTTRCNCILEKSILEDDVKSFLNGGKIPKGIDNYKAKLEREKDKTVLFLDSEIADIREKIRKKGNYFLQDEEVGTGIDVHQDFVNDGHLSKLKNPKIKKRDGIFVLSSSEKNQMKFSVKENELIKPYYTSDELYRFWGNKNNEYWVIYTNKEKREKISEYQKIKQHLDKFKTIITSDSKPYGLHRARNENFFLGEKIVSLRKTPIPRFTFTDFPCYVSQTFFVIKPTDLNMKFLTGFLNSKIVYFWLYMEKKQGSNLQVDKGPLQSIPIAVPDEPTQKSVVDKVDSIMKITKEFVQGKKSFLQRIEEQFGKSNTTKIEEFWKLSFTDILDQIQSTEQRLSPQDREDWEKFFEEKRKACAQLEESMREIETEIDEIFYKLYQLTPDEIEKITGKGLGNR